MKIVIVRGALLLVVPVALALYAGLLIRLFGQAAGF